MTILFSYFISPGFVLEVNVVMIAVGIIFFVDLYNHFNINRTMLSDVGRHFCLIGLDARMFWTRFFSLFGYVVNSIVGISMARRPTRFKFAAYIILGAMVFITMFAIGISRYMVGSDGKYYSKMMLHYLWSKIAIEPLEHILDCCGVNGAIDYEIANRTWSQASCCGSPNCPGCHDRFYAYLKKIEREIARDNIVTFIFLAIGLTLMVGHYQNLGFHEDVLSDDDDELYAQEEAHRKDLTSKT
ncbi:hypothetical protein KR222_010404 [Zaprionus bogoriensis]|nr:hypothetical protein KR222_010404 [Zaprionus bogoriensis]